MSQVVAIGTARSGLRYRLLSDAEAKGYLVQGEMVPERWVTVAMTVKKLEARRIFEKYTVARSRAS